MARHCCLTQPAGPAGQHERRSPNVASDQYAVPPLCAPCPLIGRATWSGPDSDDLCDWRLCAPAPDRLATGSQDRSGTRPVRLPGKVTREAKSMGG